MDKELRQKIKKITESFPEYRYDLENLGWIQVVYVFDTVESFFFEIPSGIDPWEVERGETGMCPQLVQIRENDEWIKIENEDLDELINITKNKLFNGKEKTTK
jgi:hypothetical protein